MKQGWIKYFLNSIALIVIGGILWFLINSGYSYSWTGFAEFTPTNPDTVPSKTLWDWMELLIIPAVLAGGAILLNRSERNAEREIANERQQDMVLQTYFDRMSELLLKEKLRTTKRAEVRDIARTRTLSIMRVLDTRRNNLVIQFLREAKLITDNNSILKNATMDFMNLQRLNMSGVNLRNAELWGANLEDESLQIADLRGAILGRANLQGAYLQGADLRGVKFWAANLRGANLEDANLQGAELLAANMQGANLRGADLQGADLESVYFRGANLQGAKLKGARNTTEKQLDKAKSLEGATMPDGTKHD